MRSILFVLVTLAAMSAAQTTLNCKINTRGMCVQTDGDWISFCPAPPPATPVPTTPRPTPIPTIVVTPIPPIVVTPFPPTTPAPPTTTVAATPIPTTKAPPAATPIPPTLAPTPVPPLTPLPPTPPPTPVPTTPIPTPGPQHGPVECINLKLHQVRELDAAGAIPLHTYNTFGAVTLGLVVNYPIAMCDAVDLGLTSTEPCAVGTSTATIAYYAVPSNIVGTLSTVTLSVAAPNQDVTIRYLGETVALFAGSGYINYNIQSYIFCSGILCGTRVGQSLELSLIAEATSNKNVAISGKTAGGADASGSIWNFDKFLAQNLLTTESRALQVTTPSYYLNSLLTYTFTGTFTRAQTSAVVTLPAKSAGSAMVVSFIVAILAILVIML